MATQKRSFFYKLALMIFPSWQFNSTPWLPLWKQQENEMILKTYRITYAVLTLGYILHYFFVDTPLGLTQDPKWAYYRFGLAAFSTLSFLATFYSKFRSSLFQRVLGFVVGLFVCYFQALSMTWYNGVPYFWGILFGILFASFLQLSMVPSLIACAIFFVIQITSMQEAGINTPIIGGAFLVGVFVTAIFRRRQSDEIALFIETQKNIMMQKKFIESQQELSDQVQAFLPKKIRERLLTNIRKNKMTVLQAMDDVLRIRKKTIAAIFSDIRGYTSGSKTEGFLENSAIPNMKVATNIVENYGGIPRQIGDLVFSYFDENDNSTNLYNSLKASLEICKMNESMNSANENRFKIRRYVLLDTGEAVVGNIGSASSGREITAMGTCVNRLSRIDSTTKEEELAKKLGFSALIMSSSFFQELILPELLVQKYISEINLPDLKIEVRDFKEETKIYFIKSEHIDELLYAMNSPESFLEAA